MQKLKDNNLSGVCFSVPLFDPEGPSDNNDIIILLRQYLKLNSYFVKPPKKYTSQNKSLIKTCLPPPPSKELAFPQNCLSPISMTFEVRGSL